MAGSPPLRKMGKETPRGWSFHLLTPNTPTPPSPWPGCYRLLFHHLRTFSSPQPPHHSLTAPAATHTTRRLFCTPSNLLGDFFFPLSFFLYIYLSCFYLLIFFSVCEVMERGNGLRHTYSHFASSSASAWSFSTASVLHHTPPSFYSF